MKKTKVMPPSLLEDGLHFLMDRQEKKDSIGGLTNRLTRLQSRAREFQGTWDGRRAFPGPLKLAKPSLQPS